MPTPEQIQAVMSRLSPEQQQQLLEEIQKRQSTNQAPPGAGANSAPTEQGSAASGFVNDVWQPGSPVDRFAGGVWKNVNPISLVKGLAQAALHPIDTIENAGAAMGQEWDKAGTAWNEGRYSEAVGHGAAGSIPLIGPAAAAAGERIGTGDVAGGLGEGVGLLVPTLAPRGAKAAIRGLKRAGVSGRLAGALETGAAAKVARAISPEVGPGKARFGNTAIKKAPQLVDELAAEGAPLTKGGLHTKIKTKLAEAKAELDAAADEGLMAAEFPAQDIVGGLKAKRSQLTAQTGGREVVPGPNVPRVATIDQALKEIDDLTAIIKQEKVFDEFGSTTKDVRVGSSGVGYEPIRKIRQAYDKQAEVVYNPSMTADFLKQKGSAQGAADVTGVLREELAKWSPETAKANAKYSLYKSLDDVMTASAEVERVRPRVGRQLMARLTGGLLGSQAGAGGAVAGYIGGPILDSVMSSGVTAQFKLAAVMKRMAEAIRKGDMEGVAKLNDQLRRLGQTAATVSGGTPTQTAPATR